MILVCLPSDALSQHLPSYLGFSYLGLGVSLHSCSSKAQLLLLTLDKGYLLTAAPPDLEDGVAPLGPPAPTQLPLLGRGVAPCQRGPNYKHPTGSVSMHGPFSTSCLIRQSFLWGGSFPNDRIALFYFFNCFFKTLHFVLGHHQLTMS